MNGSTRRWPAALAMCCVTLCLWAGRVRAEGIVITIAQSSPSLPVSTPRLADALGFFEKNGLKARFFTAENGSTALTALVSGSVEFATGGFDGLLFMRSRGQDTIAMVLNIYRGQPGVLVLRKDLQDRLATRQDDSPADRLKALAGLLIATPGASSTMTSTIQRAESLSGGGEPRFVYMTQSAMPAALTRRAIDGFIASSPYPDLAVKTGAGMFWLSGAKGEFPEASITLASNVLFTSRAFAARNPDVIRRVRAAFEDLGAAVRDRPAEVVAALKKMSPDLSDQVVQSAFEQNAPNWLHPDLSDADIRREIDMYKASVNIPVQIDPSSLIIPR